MKFGVEQGKFGVFHTLQTGRHSNYVYYVEEKLLTMMKINLYSFTNIQKRDVVDCTCYLAT